MAARSGTRCLIFGPEGELRASLGDDAPPTVEIVDAPVGISNEEEPARAVRAKRDASIVQAAEAVAEGRADAAVSAGSTGAALAAGLLRTKRLPGVHRPAVAVQLPLPKGRVLFLDVGANVEVRPENLVQFAHMGAAFSERVLGVDRPRVGLLSVGEEPAKGTPQVVAAHRQLLESSLEFVGNVEGNGLVAGEADVVVTDGFTGNVALKLMEGTVRIMGQAVREAALSGVASRVGGLLLRPKLAGLRGRLDPEAVGGAYLLGLRGLVVICHGSSTRRAIAAAIGLAERGVERRVVAEIGSAFAETAGSDPSPGGAAAGGAALGEENTTGASVSADTVR
jgi:glycerol-3-phosphate acyltransferase PlsX